MEKCHYCVSALRELHHFLALTEETLLSLKIQQVTVRLVFCCYLSDSH